MRREGIEPPTRWLKDSGQVVALPERDPSIAPELPNVAPVLPLRARSQHFTAGIPATDTGV